jgi:hypothetical protein
MNLYFYFRGENGKLESIGPYSFENEVINKLGKDFSDYCQPSPSNVNAKKGGWYNCKADDKDTILFLKFDEIIYIG